MTTSKFAATSRAFLFPDIARTEAVAATVEAEVGDLSQGRRDISMYSTFTLNSQTIDFSAVVFKPIDEVTEDDLKSFVDNWDAVNTLFNAVKTFRLSYQAGLVALAEEFGLTPLEMDARLEGRKRFSTDA